MVDADATDIYVYLKRAVRNTIKKPAQCVMSNSRVPKELFAKKIREWVDQFAHTLQSTDIKEFIQELVIDPFFNVRETLEIYAGYYGIEKSKRRTDEIIEALGLKDKALSKPRSLSGGMRRRLLVAKALVHNPEILVLDEPTAGVDVELRNQLWNYVKKLNQSGTTILLTTHYLEEAEELCDEIAIINHGQVIACDKKENLMNVLSSKELIISCVEDEGSKMLALFPELQTKLLAQDKISITYDPQKIAVAKILHTISDSKIQIKDISTKQPDLEEIFKHLIKAQS